MATVMARLSGWLILVHLWWRLNARWGAAATYQCYLGSLYLARAYEPR